MVKFWWVSVSCIPQNYILKWNSRWATPVQARFQPALNTISTEHGLGLIFQEWQRAGPGLACRRTGWVGPGPNEDGPSQPKKVGPRRLLMHVIITVSSITPILCPYLYVPTGGVDNVGTENTVPKNARVEIACL